MIDSLERQNRFREFPQSIRDLYHHNKFVQASVEDYCEKRFHTKEEVYCQIIHALIQCSEHQHAILINTPPKPFFMKGPQQ